MCGHLYRTDIQCRIYTYYCRLCFSAGAKCLFCLSNLKWNIDIVKVGLIYKSIQVALALYYWCISQLPHLMFGIFRIMDLFFIVLFALYIKAVLSH